MIKTSKIQIPLYGGELVIYQDKTLKRVEIKHNLTACSGCDAVTFQLNKKNGSGRFYMAFERNISPSIIAHESLHVMNLILNHACYKLDIENDEAQAYLLGWIVEKCHNFLKVKNEK